MFSTDNVDRRFEAFENVFFEIRIRLRAYNAPFPDESFTAGVRVALKLMPYHPHHPGVEMNKNVWWDLQHTSVKFQTMFSANDVLTFDGEEKFKRFVNEAGHLNHPRIPNARHFFNKENSDFIAKHLNIFLSNNGIRSKPLPPARDKHSGGRDSAVSM